MDLAIGAADVVRRTARAGAAVSVKSTRTDLVTEADTVAERWLVDRIAQARPHDAVLGEEGGARAGDSGVRWVLDPIDGTVNFVLGIPQYAVSVAAEQDGVVVAGAVCNVATAELFHAHRGGGAFLHDAPLSGPRPVDVGRAVVGTGFAYTAQRRRRQAAVVAGLLPEIADIRRLGAASLDLCAVAAGRLDGYFEAGLHPWDYAAGLLVAVEAGCVATGLRGRAPGEGFVAVAGPALASGLFALLQQLDADGVIEG